MLLENSELEKLYPCFSSLCSILFPDPNGTQRKGTVFITGTVDAVIEARSQLIVRRMP